MTIATRFATSADGTCIAYDMCGGGAPLILLHGGYIQNRRSWHEAGYVESLASDFRVISIDLRGHGESDAPTDPAQYTMGKLVADVLAVADACAASRFLVWGFSLGGTIALHLAARSPRPQAIVVAGSFFGKLLDDEHVKQVTEGVEKTAIAKEQGQLDALALPPTERWFADRANLRVVLALTAAGPDWPPIEPPDLQCPAYVFAGSRNAAATAALTARRAALEAAGVRVQIFEGLDHMQEFTDGEVVFPQVKSFLNGVRDARRRQA
jgi:pimeloyl-ACP methyl ester carboxylesterase